MYTCSFNDVSEYCTTQFITPEALFLHIQMYHNDMRTYTCGETNCARTFQRLDSFKRHVKNKHPQRQVIENPAVIVDTETVNINPIDPLPTAENIPKQNISTISPVHVTQTLTRLSQTYLADLHSDQTLSRTTLQRIINKTSGFICNIGTLVENLVVSEPASRNNLDSILSFLNNPFPSEGTEYRRTQLLQKSGFFVRPEKIFIGQEIHDKIIDDATVSVPVAVNVTFIPLRKLFKTLFTVPTVLEAAKSFLSKEVTGCIDDIAHSLFWRQKRQLFNDKFVIPLHIFYDEFECNNPIGSRVGIHKIGAVYVSPRCFPVHFQSRLENIFIALLVQHKDIVHYGNRVFQILVDELTFLETEGIQIELNNEEVCTIYFSLAMILGDNAGLNAILGYSGCSSNHFCRICRGHKHDLLRSVKPVDHALMRTPINYNEDLQINDFRMTGIKENCIFNQIPSFHVVDNNAVDIMHDMLEGVCNYDMTLIIAYYLHVEVFSLHSLNTYIKSFDYGYIEYRNKPPSVSENMLAKKKLNMKANEMMCFVRNFGLMVGCAIPEGDAVWKLYTTLCDIMDIVMAPLHHVGSHDLLKILIEEHHTLYLDTCKKVPKYENERLKPKFHYMMHYPAILNLYGPLRNFWCMRYEGKHKVGKDVAQISGSRVKIMHTIATTHQTRLAYSLTHESGVRDLLDVGPKITFNHCTTPDYLHGAKMHKWAKWNGRLYKPHKCVVYVNTVDDLPCFGFITGIFVKEKRLYFMLKSVPSISFNEHNHSYVVDVSNLSLPESHYMNIEDLFESTPLHLRKVLHFNYVTLPYM